MSETILSSSVYHIILIVALQQAGGDIDELCPSNTSIHCTYVSVKCRPSVTATHQPSQQNKGKPLSLWCSRKGWSLLCELHSSKAQHDWHLVTAHAVCAFCTTSYRMCWVYLLLVHKPWAWSDLALGCRGVWVLGLECMRKLFRKT